MNKEYIDKAYDLLKAVMLALMAAIFSGVGYLLTRFEEIGQIRLIITCAGLAFLFACFCIIAFCLLKILKGLKGD